MTDRQKLIAEASQAYYSTGTSPLSDAEFDALLEEERKENPDSPVLGIGHGYDINKDQRKDKKIPHKYGIVGSLDKCHNWDELPKSFKDREKRIASLKLDGSSCVMYYKNGEMYLALTRGQVVNDISVGIDITDKVKKIAPQYASISDKTFTGAVRGETLMSHDNFKKYKELHPEASNARNSTAGLMGQKEVVDDLKFLNIIVYTIIGSEGLGSYIAYDTILAWLTAQYGKENVVPHQEFSYSEYNFIHQMEFFKTMWYNKFPADGIVLTDIAVEAVDNSRIYNAVAFKFKAEVKEATVTGIEWNLSKTKYLVPTVLVSPVELSGAIVSRVAGNNAKNIVESGLGVGAKVKMYRSGEVIPYIDEVIEKVPAALPDKCPCCGLDLIWKGVHLVCDNPDCADMKTQDLLIWCENIAPVDGLGDTLKLKFFDEIIEAYELPQSALSIEDIYDLSSYWEFRCEGAQEKLFMQMLLGLKNNKVPMYKALLALNIPRIGDITAKKLAQHIDVIESLVDGCYPSDKLLDIVGEATTGTILENLNKFHRLSYIWDNIDKTVVSADVVKVAITGSLESMPRSQFEKLLNAHGFVLGDITKDTKYLITNTPNSSSSKNAKADKLGIEKITENEFRSRYL